MVESLYIHIPFCQNICYYCDFKRGVYNEAKVDAYIERIKEELQRAHVNQALRTIYIGGGTPSSLSEVQLQSLLSLVHPYAAQCEEWSVESNIESLNKEKLECMVRYGVNRISLGVQSLQPALLERMNRKHTKEDVFLCIDEIFECGIENISVDLMYGFEGQNQAAWEHDVKTLALNHKVTHISLYSLTIEEHSVFGKRGERTCDNEEEAYMYEKAIAILESNGFIHYEVANFCRPTYASKHNLSYWKYNDFYGIGWGASGMVEQKRYEVLGSLSRYLEGADTTTTLPLSREDRIFENVMMSLRMKEGLSLHDFKKRYHQDIFEIYETQIQEEIDKGNLLIEDGHMMVTKKGMFYLHDVLVTFLR